MSEHRVIIGEAIRQYLREKNLTQADAAEKLGVNKAYVNMLINGTTSLGRGIAKKLHDAFGFSETFLLTGSGSLIEGPKTYEQTMNIFDSSKTAIGDGAAVDSFNSSIPAGPEASKAMDVPQILFEVITYQKQQIERLQDENLRLLEMLTKKN